MPSDLFLKENAKSLFLNEFSKLKMNGDSFVSIFEYMKELDKLVDDLYNTGFNDGFQKSANLDVNKN